jgi:(4S)-4-hydroxy-5-phosphonooxypentane-2,3-dione isomerase
MSGYVVIVDFHLRAGALPAFRRLVDANARASAREEPGCRRFDVVEPSEGTDRVLLYEIYNGRAAFEAHMRTGHYLSFDAESTGLVLNKTITTGALVCEGTA